MTSTRYIYFTNNIAGMVVFYRDALGMTVLEPPLAMDYDPDSWIQLAGAGFEVCIHGAGKPGCRDRNRNKLVFVVDDVAEYRDRLIGRGVSMGKLQTMSHYESCDFKDPDGNVLQLSNR